MDIETDKIVVPEKFRQLFWDCRFDDLRWDEHRDYIVSRIIESENDEALTWLHDQFGRNWIRNWFYSMNRPERFLSSRSLRYLETELKLPHERIDRLVLKLKSSVWERGRS